jgi:hypothetical protein
MVVMARNAGAGSPIMGILVSVVVVMFSDIVTASYMYGNCISVEKCSRKTSQFQYPHFKAASGDIMYFRLAVLLVITIM